MTFEAYSPSSDPCPTNDQLQAFNRGQLEAEAVDSISRHLQSCARCAVALLSVSEAASAAYPRVEGDASTPPSRAEATNQNPTQAVDAGATVSFGADATPRKIGRYTVLRILGKGGFGVVYLARDRELDRLVAVKAPHAERIKRSKDLEAYRREARLHAGVDHGHIVPIYDVGAAEDTPFFVVSKFVPGIDLAARLRGAPPDFRTAADWVATLAEALDHVHRQGVIHRDVKPRNIMVDPAGRVYLMDFGLAKQAGRHDGAEPIVGTPAYMAPEQARGEPLDGRCDVYALGMVLYELLTGERPFRGDPTSIVQQVLTIEPPLPRSVKRAIPRDLEAICVKALAKDRERRYRTAADFAEDVRRWLRAEPLRFARRVGPMERGWSWTRRHRAVAGLGGVALITTALYTIGVLRTPAEDGLRLDVTLQSKPPGAALHFFPLDESTGLPRADLGKKAVAGSTVRLAPGYHLVIATLDDGRFQEVFRYVPPDLDALPDVYRHNGFTVKGNLVQLRDLEFPRTASQAAMSLVAGADRFMVGIGELGHVRRVPAYYIDCHEVTVGEFLKVRSSFQFPPDVARPPDNWPMVFVNWDDAVAYAEDIGRRLLD